MLAALPTLLGIPTGGGFSTTLLSRMLSSMTMDVTQIALFWLGIFLESLLLLRALKVRLFTRYSLFYFYLSAVLVVQILEAVAMPLRRVYSFVYWFGEPITAALGCAIMFELYRQCLARYPGAARLSRNVMTFVFALVISRTIAQLVYGRALKVTFLTFERDIRILELIFLAGLLLLVRYYAISLGRNITGMAIGYGVYIMFQIVHITIRMQRGDSFEPIWNHVQPFAYLLVLCVWTVALWSYAPAAAPASAPAMDYDELHATTRQHLGHAENRLSRIAKS